MKTSGASETCYRQASQRDGPDYQRHPEDQEGRCSIKTHAKKYWFFCDIFNEMWTFVFKKKGDDRKSDKMLTFVLRNIYKKSLISCLQFLLGVFSDSAIRHKKQHHCARGLFSTIPRSFSLLFCSISLLLLKFQELFLLIFCPY